MFAYEYGTRYVSAYFCVVFCISLFAVLSVYPLAILFSSFWPFTASVHLLYIFKPFLCTYYRSPLVGFATYAYHSYVISDNCCRPYVETPHYILSSVNIICFRWGFLYYPSCPLFILCRLHTRTFQFLLNRWCPITK